MNSCTDISVIPQFVGTCWFNAILMITLYSENIRKLLIKESKKWKNPNTFLRIIKQILKNYNKPEKVQEFFKKIKPEYILLKMLKTFNDTHTIEQLKPKIKNDTNTGYTPEYIIKFFKFLGLKTLDIVVMKQLGWIYNSYTYLLNTDKEFNNYHQLDDEKTRKYIKKRVFDDIVKTIKEVPDIIVVKHEDLINNFAKPTYTVLKYLIPEFNSSFYSSMIKIEGLENYNDIITFNGHRYKLEAVPIGNFNVKDIGSAHAITGITCNGERYVYNGWNKATANSPCSLMKYDWNVRKDEPFCLNKVKCKLDFIETSKDVKNLCFSFGKGLRLLIYVRMNDEEIDMKMSSRSDRDIQLSGISSLIDEIYIKGMSNESIVRILENEYGITIQPFLKENRDFLEKKYYNELKKKLKLSK